MKNVVEHLFGYNQPTTTTYDSGKTYIGTSGTFIKQYSGITSADNYISTFPLSVGRPMEASTAIAVAYPWVYSWSNTIDWIFLCDIGTAAATRRVVLMEYDKTTNQFSWKGFITQTGPGGNETSRGMRAHIYLHTTGTTQVDGINVNGTDTLWKNEGIAVGARIGFGTTSPTGVTDWYEISSINSNTGITLLSTAGTIPSGTSYVIEEIRIYLTLSNATTTNGGLFIIKGLNYSTFIPNGTIIPFATTIDNIRAVYWLKSSATETMIAAWGLAYQQPLNFTTHYAYIMAGAVAANSYFCYKFNLRKLLQNLSAGATTEAFEYQTGAINSALTGTIIIANNGRILTLNHGPGSGVESLYFTTTTRIYRCPVSTITSGSTSYIADSMVEVPPGGTSTYIASTFSGIEAASVIDKLVVTGGAAGRSYVTDYNTVSNPIDTIFLANDIQYDSSLVDGGAPIHPTTNATVMSHYIENGFLYLIRNGTTAALNQIYCLPLSAHRSWADQTGEFIITPKLITTGCIKFYRVYTSRIRQVGDSTFGVPTEEYDLLYRITGIDDNSGSWNLVYDNGDLSGISGSNEIQFKIRLKTLGTFCIPARIYSIVVIYEDSQTDSHYTPSVNKSSVTGRIFSYRQTSLWGSNIPNLRIRLYNASTGGNILDDTVNSSSLGTWQYSTDGTNWNTWSSSADSIGNYIRYTATTLPDSIIVRALLTQ